MNYETKDTEDLPLPEKLEMKVQKAAYLNNLVQECLEHRLRKWIEIWLKKNDLENWTLYSESGITPALKRTYFYFGLKPKDEK